MIQDQQQQCFICGEENENVLEEHHKIPQRYGGSDIKENLVTLCSNCHQAVEKIYDGWFWHRLELYKTWDMEIPKARYKIWTTRGLVAWLENLMESRRLYLEEYCEYDDIEFAGFEEMGTSEQAFQLGRFQAWASLRRHLLNETPDKSVRGARIEEFSGEDGL